MNEEFDDKIEDSALKSDSYSQIEESREEEFIDIDKFNHSGKIITSKQGSNFTNSYRYNEQTEENKEHVYIQ